MISSDASARLFGRELDEDMLAGIVAVAVLDRVDDGLADRDADIMLRVVVQPERAPHVIAHHLDEIEHFERAGELEPDHHVGSRVAVARRSGDAAPGPLKRRDAALAAKRREGADVRSSHMPSSTAGPLSARPPSAGTSARPGRQVDFPPLRPARGPGRRPVDPDQFFAGSRLPIDAGLPAPAGVDRSYGRRSGTVTVMGRGFGRQFTRRPPLDAGNSGTTMRLLAGVLAGHPFSSR